MLGSNHPTMEVLTGATGITMNRSHFSNVGKDQYNDCTVHQTIVQTRCRRKKFDRDLPELSEFTEIKRGDIYKNKDMCYSWRLCSNGKDNTEAAVYHAEVNITGSEFGQKKFTVKTYRGRNAMKEWRRDFTRCSKDWLRDVPLFGYNKSSVPSLIFCGELVPLAHIEGGLGSVGLYYISLLRRSLGCSRNQLWMDPTQGKFCLGPIGPECRDWQDEFINDLVPSDVEFLKEEVVIRYFASKQDDRGLLYTLSYSHLEILQVDVPVTSHTQVISGLTNSTIAFLENVRWRRWKDCLHDERVIPDGATRFCLRDNRRKIRVESIGEQGAWLSQALSVFHVHNISLDEDLSTYKFVVPYFKLRGTIQECKRKRQRRQLLRVPIYLILLPSPTPVCRWTFDPAGQTLLSPEMCKYLGLPLKLSLEVIPFQISWPTKIYKAFYAYQIARRFDPKSTDFAQSLRYPIFDVVPAENRFQDILEEQDEIVIESEALPSPKVHAFPEDSESVLDSNAYNGHIEVQSPEESDDSFTLHLLFNETEASSKTSNDADPVQTSNLEYTQQGTLRSILGTIFCQFTWEAVEGSGISAAAI
ncbi:hypothetical protein E1B28_011719 [Marasmius oreades]|uniref:Uncharacterized protein n=1 Tax=Marasmius oreades TaxID=181124 RepID=A0A9P7UPW2_9AGAR|nr:uncharacterized protein E1B28_011719 [Marasmius oreades]KAG7090107.1 hypothetical protein E1B28_011719 [Marasmius oreades]